MEQLRTLGLTAVLDALNRASCSCERRLSAQGGIVLYLARLAGLSRDDTPRMPHIPGAPDRES